METNVQAGSGAPGHRTGYVFIERGMWHDCGPSLGWQPSGIREQDGLYIQPDQHIESPETKRRLHNLLAVCGLLDELLPLKPRPATVDDLLRFHTREYVDRVKQMSDFQGGDAGEVAPFGVGGFETALWSVGGCIAAVDAVLAGHVKNAYALVRPPGHHAERDRGRGFCIFSNVALAALHAQKVRGVKKVAVVDWDVHHGNGTQQAFYDDPSVLMVSIHQDGLYPAETGKVAETGSGAGVGFNINIPLPPGSGNGAYEAAFERVVLPAVRAFEPELILVSCGFDAAALDPLSTMMLSSASFRKMATRLQSLADELPSCRGRLVACHEGGYSVSMVPFCGLAVIEVLSGPKVNVMDPYLEEIEQYPYQALQVHQDAVITRAEANVALLKSRLANSEGSAV
eukprot:TRINITY_DN1821_c0_g1_i1.p1 TRINITY_DN1821_c0_g1~~TRINITY_DN1821_c0_g1_i1.p1  ORF type:complete len:399 (-),score=106.79 TRINITY_DN1821_c0_g1_i1:135-1331(-)